MQCHIHHPSGVLLRHRHEGGLRLWIVLITHPYVLLRHRHEGGLRPDILTEAGVDNVLLRHRHEGGLRLGRAQFSVVPGRRCCCVTAMRAD